MENLLKLVDIIKLSWCKKYDMFRVNKTHITNLRKWEDIKANKRAHLKILSDIVEISRVARKAADEYNKKYKVL